VTLGTVPSQPTYRVELASFNAYQLDEYWVVQCIATISDEGGFPVSIDTDITEFFTVNWVSMDVVLVSGGGGGGGGGGEDV
jgi:hypothetical protein